MNCLIELHYLPCIAYFSGISGYDTIVIEKNEFYEKQTYRNRCHINTSRGKERLIIPLTSKHGKVRITEVQIDYSQKWLNNHLRAIESAYRNAPYFEHYFDDFRIFVSRKPKFLYEFNLELLTICLSWLQLDVHIAESVSYNQSAKSGTLDLRNRIHPKKPELCRNFFMPAPYQQVFGKSFVNNLSLIDLVMCEGPDALRIVQTSAIPFVNK